MNVFALIDACQAAYDSAAIVSSGGRDAASVTVAPDGSVVVAFRGTLVAPTAVSLEDWANDLAARLVQADGFAGRVHAGFLGSLDSVWGQVFDAVEATPAEAPWARKLYLTGHSKGGACALLAGVRLAALSPVVVTFGAPRTGDAEFAALYPEGVRVVRYEGEDDLVPHLPPYVFGYHSVGGVRTQGRIPEVLREARINRLIAAGRWEDVLAAHHLGGPAGYASWIQDEDVPPPAVPARRAA